MWSTPVHRWLSSCVHWPMLEAAAAAAHRRSGDAAEVKAKGGNGDKTGANGVGNGSSDKDGKKPPTPGWLPAVLATFVVSGVFHEAVVFVAMRGTCWPFNTFLLIVASSLMLTWDTVFPLRQGQQGVSASAARGCGDSSAVTTKHDNAAVGGAANGVRFARGHGSRGIASMVTFTVLVQLSACICECAAWMWWRHVLMK